ncbi:Coenzyme PQQ synthesis protein D (PqqD) [Roseovarius pacificus]|uniref:Coenzyme PQQ synthesis protein D (PqqD) n=1 Tax=Roseovarius pacificus TaxID=337701 RepID=A0A1M7BAG7_9RHOB|nr:PqqD family protein [Roseovarius pacificus]GGO54850.1 hypothetical protein GCM10011315_15980 [Roseovarius pacificus]SHL51927.1 Coenzyme PQQ synthesis protein D (PqqD) [Roseovarius pacificus]
MRAPQPRVATLTFPDAPHVIELHDSDMLCRTLETVMPAWTGTMVHGPVEGATPVTTIRQHEDGSFSFRSRWGQHPLTDLGLAGATCGAVADITQSYLDARPGIFGLHCGAVRIGGHLIAFTGTYRAGKTTLVARLGIEPDFELFCDDVLPIGTDGKAVALGIQPRLRLPLPDTVAPGFGDYVSRSLTVHDRRYGYVSIPTQAPHGTRAPLAALVVLSRRDGGPARFHRMEPAKAAACLIRQNIADPGEAKAHYDRVAAMAEGLTCFHLVYSDLEEAVALIRAAFEAPAIPAADLDIGAAFPPEDPDGEGEPADLDGLFARAGDVSDRQIGTDTFLWQMDGRNFFSLNPVGAGVWALLENPVTGWEIVATLREVFTDVAPDAIGADVSALLGQMRQAGLVVLHDTGPIQDGTEQI